MIAKDLKIIQLPAGGSWWTLAQNQGEWLECINTLANSSRCPLRPGAPGFCDDCQLFFRCPGDLKHHKCRAERNLPVQDQLGAVHCTKGDRWFRSKGGLAVHKCAQPASSELLAMPLRSSSDRSCCAAHCELCNRCFKSKAGFARHKCDRGRQQIGLCISLCAHDASDSSGDAKTSPAT